MLPAAPGGASQRRAALPAQRLHAQQPLTPAATTHLVLHDTRQEKVRHVCSRPWGRTNQHPLTAQMTTDLRAAMVDMPTSSSFTSYSNEFRQKHSTDYYLGPDQAVLHLPAL